MNRCDLVVIDDEFTVLYTIRAILEEEFPSLETFTNPGQGVEFVISQGARVVITDLSMPEMNGVEVLERIRAHDPDIQVIILTAHGSEKIAVDAMKSGAFYYITKPFDPEELKLIVNKALQQYAHLKEIHYDNDLASNLQKNLLPQQSLLHDDYRLTFHYLPGGVVGGDYFDFLFLPDGSLGIIIADAMGHGVASAMIMAMLKMVFLSMAPLHNDPAFLLGALNAQFYPVLKTRGYFTACYAVVSADPPRITFSSAGHPAPLFYRSAEKRLLDLELSGMSIGMFPDVDYRNIEIPLEKGDNILFFTDGLQDINGSDEFFKDFLNHFCEFAYNNTLDLLERMAQIVETTLQDPNDDLTMLLFQY